jgi:hypothetical protein
MTPELAESTSDDYFKAMDRRLVILETRFDTILPSLATKADLVALEMRLTEVIHKTNASMHKWLAATCISLLLGFAGLSVTLFGQIQYSNQQTAQNARLLEQLIAAQQQR